MNIHYIWRIIKHELLCWSKQTYRPWKTVDLKIVLIDLITLQYTNDYYSFKEIWKTRGNPWWLRAGVAYKFLKLIRQIFYLYSIFTLKNRIPALLQGIWFKERRCQNAGNGYISLPYSTMISRIAWVMQYNTRVIRWENSLRSIKKLLFSMKHENFKTSLCVHYQKFSSLSSTSFSMDT